MLSDHVDVHDRRGFKAVVQKLPATVCGIRVAGCFRYLLSVRRLIRSIEYILLPAFRDRCAIISLKKLVLF